jgi:hypothetical protein
MMKKSKISRNRTNKAKKKLTKKNLTKKQRDCLFFSMWKHHLKKRTNITIWL